MQIFSDYEFANGIVNIELEQNELTLSDSQSGFFSAEEENISFLSVKSITKTESDNLRIDINLSIDKNLYSRTAYTLLDLLGDFGGFTDAIIFIFGTVMSFYSASMYEASIASEFTYSVDKSH